MYMIQYSDFPGSAVDAAVTTGAIPNLSVGMITNADQGIALSWEADTPSYCAKATVVPNACTIQVPAASTYSFGANTVSSLVWPVLQAQDGSYYGYDDNYDMIHFDQSGNVKWSVPNDSPQIATADGGVIGSSGITYDNTGKATGQIANLPTQSWTGNGYQNDPGQAQQVASTPPANATSYAAVNGGNPSAAASPVPSNTYVPSLGAIYRSQIASDAKGYVGNSTKWVETHGTTCNIFVNNVLEQASDETSLSIPAPTRPTRYRYGIIPRIDAFLAADWANPSKDGGCWKPLPAGPYGALPGDVLAADPANGHDGTGHVGIVVDPSLLTDPNLPNGLIVKFASAASVPPYWITDVGSIKAFIPGTITLTDYGFRLPGFDFTNPQDVQGLKQDSVVRRFSCY